MTDNKIEHAIHDLEVKLTEATDHANPEHVAKRHAEGKLTARERVHKLLDPHSFHETDALVVHRCTDFGIDKKKIPGDGVITGWGTIGGRKVFLFSQDFMDFGGALGEVFAKKVVKIMDLAMSNRCPIIGLNDSGGARIQEGVMSLGGYGDIFFRNTQASGYIPQISAILGPCAGGAVYSPAITDFIFMVRDTSHMFITGQKSGVCHFECKDEQSCLDEIRALLGYLPQNCEERSPRSDYDREQVLTNDDLLAVVPDHHRKVYDMRRIMKLVADRGSWLEVSKNFASNFITAFARVAGRPVGVLGNNPMNVAGCLNINASDKAARFVRFCDCFNIPMITFVDVPGFLPGADQEHNGIIRHGAKLLYAYSEATVPMVTVIVRKAYGGAYDAMCSKHIGGDLNFAWPFAEIAVMGPRGAVEVLHARELEGMLDETQRKAFIDEKENAYRQRFASPYVAARYGYLDDVITPHNTRFRIIKALRMLATKKDVNPAKKHANIPL